MTASIHRNRRARLLGASLLASGAMLAPALGHAQMSDDVIKIGLMTSLTGPYSGNGGVGVIAAARLAIDEFGGKINGKPIELLTLDDQNKPDIGLDTARKWLDVDKIDAMLNGSASSIALGVQTLMKERQKPVMYAGPVTADLTGKACSPMGMQFQPDTYAMPKAGVRALMSQGLNTFFFITVDYTFGASLQESATRFINESGGKVVGSVKHPLGTSDFSSYLLQAQASGAKAIVVLSAGLDLSNALKQASEFRIAKGGQAVSVFGMTINNVTAMGLEAAQGLRITAPFYWDHNEATRAWSKRFMERYKEGVPTYIMAGAYSAVLHYLKAVAATGTDAGPAVAAKMKSTPINDVLFKDIKIREDGQVMLPLYSVEVKTPQESKGKFDYYKLGAPVPPEQAFRPMSEGGCDFVKK